MFCFYPWCCCESPHSMSPGWTNKSFSEESTKEWDLGDVHVQLYKTLLTCFPSGFPTFSLTSKIYEFPVSTSSAVSGFVRVNLDQSGKSKMLDLCEAFVYMCWCLNTDVSVIWSWCILLRKKNQKRKKTSSTGCVKWVRLVIEDYWWFDNAFPPKFLRLCKFKGYDAVIYVYIVKWLAQSG